MATTSIDPTKTEKALREFVSTINNTGGVWANGDGTHSPVADDDWIDIGEAYMAACEALGEEPMVSQAEVEPPIEYFDAGGVKRPVDEINAARTEG